MSVLWQNNYTVYQFTFSLTFHVVMYCVNETDRNAYFVYRSVVNRNKKITRSQGPAHQLSQNLKNWNNEAVQCLHRCPLQVTVHSSRYF